jgi:glycosyltransferase involved in cell wall biosynthesis
MKSASVLDDHAEKAAPKPPLRVAAFTGGRDVASARFRLRQFVEPLSRFGITINENYSRVSSYPPPVSGASKRLVQGVWGVRSLGSRVSAVLASHRYDLTFLQREIISKHVTLEWATNGPRIFDVDDAIWLDGGGAADRIAQLCDLVICGNGFLAEHFTRYNQNVEILPTAVDSDRFKPLEPPRTARREIVIGWSGAAGGLYQLEMIAPALRTVLRAHDNVKLLVVSQKPPHLPDLPAAQVEFRQWSEVSEVADLQSMDIGIMPLPDDDHSRGKCSYKMLLYMACSQPVVVSPIGMNGEVLTLGEVGYPAGSIQAWTDSLIALVRDRDLAGRLGRNGRHVVTKHFSREILTRRLAQLMWRVSEGRRK